MKKLIIMMLVLMMVLSFTACGSNEKNVEVLTAEQIINYFAQEGMPIGNVIIYTEETDPNNLLGRPNGYSSKVNFEDERTLKEFIDVSNSDYMPGNSLEIFDNEDDAQARYVYIETISKGTAIAQYMYLEGTMLLRLERTLLPTDAKDYEVLLKAVSGDYQAVIAAPGVTRIIENYDVIPDKILDLAPGEHIISGFDMAKNQTISFGGIDFSFPAYFDVLKDNSTESYITYYPEEKYYFASLIFWYEDMADKLITQDIFDTIISCYDDGSQDIFNLLGMTIDDVDNVLKSQRTTIAEMSGWSLAFEAHEQDRDVFGAYSFVYNANAEKVIHIYMQYDSLDTSNYDYFGDYEKILKSAILSSEQGTPVSAITTTVNWRRFLKDYEKFMDAYIDILKQYKENPADLNIISDYMNLMAELEVWNDKYDDMSNELDDPAELTEFLNEWTRIYTKQINAIAGL